MRLPVRTALLQNILSTESTSALVRLPVRTALLQNMKVSCSSIEKCDYQSERHCSKTSASPSHTKIGAITSQNGTAPKRHQGSADPRIVRLPVRTALLQNKSNSLVPPNSVRLPVRTALLQNAYALRLQAHQVRLPVRTALLQNSILYLVTHALVRLPVRTALLQNTIECFEVLPFCAITSQNGTAPKHQQRDQVAQQVRLPVRTALLQNTLLYDERSFCVRLPVRTALLQNKKPEIRLVYPVRLPVRTALLQNSQSDGVTRSLCDYQSERHCSKTPPLHSPPYEKCDYQSERHCSKTSFQLCQSHG